MNTLRIRRTGLYAGIMSALIATLLVTSLAVASAPAKPSTPPPDGFGKFLVYMATGVYNPSDSSYTPPDGIYFQKVIMGRTEAQIAQNRLDAIAFFKTRFGIDPTDAALQNRVMFVSFTFDPRNEYRAYVISDEQVPTPGWVVRDGGWMLSVTDPAGITLGGEFAGRQVPKGTAMVFGDYNIKVLSKGEEHGRGEQSPKRPEPIIIHYQSGEPIVPTANGGIMFRCELISAEFGHGLAQGISAPQTLPDGRIQANVRNVLTFPGLGTNAQ